MAAEGPVQVHVLLTMTMVAEAMDLLRLTIPVTLYGIPQMASARTNTDTPMIPGEIPLIQIIPADIYNCERININER